VLLYQRFQPAFPHPTDTTTPATTPTRARRQSR
jgi:hypothetical protein